MRIMNKNNTNAVPLNTTTLNTRLLNTTKLNTIGFPVLSKRSGSSADISQAIMDSLVCWYDIGKQQCTNESMAANPVLADLSGNGHDITCYNFGWSGMSGIGGYNWTYNKFTTKDNFEHTDESVTLVNSDKTTFERIFNISNISNIVKGQKIKVSGINGNVKITAYVQVSNVRFTPLVINDITITKNGEYNIEDINFAEIEDAAYFYQGFKNISIPEGVTVKIENIPLYPNALVSDGVDDYCYTDGLPILTDYTVIAKRKWLGYTGNCAVASKMRNDNELNGAFGLEHIDTNQVKEYWNFGLNNRDVLFPEGITYGTPTSYNGDSVNKGNLPDTDVLSLFSMRKNLQSAGQIALYSFLLFDRTLTTAEIEWVKKNMIESEGVATYVLHPLRFRHYSFLSKQCQLNRLFVPFLYRSCVSLASVTVGAIP